MRAKEEHMRVVIAGVLGGIVMFGWGAVSWTMIPWHSVGKLSDEAEVVGALKDSAATDGVYFAPAMPEGEEDAQAEDWELRYAEGPLAFIAYRRAGKDADMTMSLVRGFALSFLSVLLAAAMLATARLRGWFGRFLFVVGFGLLAAIGEGYYWNYFAFPDDWTAAMAADHIVAWALAGLVLASIVRSAAAPPA
jgi:hypothetical protein